MIGEFQPKFDYRPAWKHVDPTDPTSPWVPDIDETTGLQRVQRVPLETYHQIYWPSDPSVSAITAKAWFTLTKGWENKINTQSGTFWFIGAGTNYLRTDGFNLVQDREFTTELPAGTKKISVRINPHEHALGWTIEAAAR